MGETSNMFPVSWKQTLNRIKEVEEQDVLHDIEMPKWPRSKLIYLMFLVIYILVEFPASRLVLAYESVVKNEARTPGSVALIIVRVLLALMMLPLFVLVWMILVIWNILHSILHYIWTLGEFQEKMDKQLLEEAVTEYVEAEEKGKEQDGGNEGDWKGASLATQVEKSNKKEKELKERAMERKAELKEKVEEMRRAARKGKQDRVQKQVALLINPPRLYDAKTKGLASRRENEDQRMRNARTGTPASSLDQGEGTIKPNQDALPETEMLTRRSIWRLARGPRKKAIDEEVRVAGQDGPSRTAELTQDL